ncbi:high affinity substrate binding lipoprotein, partial [Dietzia cinnamea P4]
MRLIPTAAALAITAFALSACGTSEADPAASGEPDALAAPAGDERCTEDKAGGTITMGTYVMLPSFSPGQGQVGVRGGAESAAVYDRLVRWNAQTETFEPKLAESLESNDDHTVWTLTLRDGVTFSNGEPLTAQDVAFTMDLHKDPATRSTAMTDVQQIQQTRVIDPLTVEFTLAEPWSTFPVLLAGSAGEVIPEKAYTEAGPEKWAREPVGAGAFTLASYTPNQEMVFEPNPDYYGGPVCPTLRFIQIPGSQATLEAFRNGEVEVGFLRGSKFADMAREADAQGYEEITSAGRVVYMNNGVAGYDGILTDQRARLAVTHAIDRELLLSRLGDDAAQARRTTSPSPARPSSRAASLTNRSRSSSSKGTAALARYLIDRFGQEKIVVYGVSWSSILGVWLVQDHPELFYAFVSSGQMVNTSQNDRLGYKLALAHLDEHGENDRAEQLRANGPPPYRGDAVVWKYVDFLDVLNEIMDTPRYTLVVPLLGFLVPEYGYLDTINHTRGLIASFNAIYPQ